MYVDKVPAMLLVYDLNHLKHNLFVLLVRSECWSCLNLQKLHLRHDSLPIVKFKWNGTICTL